MEEAFFLRLQVWQESVESMEHSHLTFLLPLWLTFTIFFSPHLINPWQIISSEASVESKCSRNANVVERENLQCSAPQSSILKGSWRINRIKFWEGTDNQNSEICSVFSSVLASALHEFNRNLRPCTIPIFTRLPLKSSSMSCPCAVCNPALKPSVPLTHKMTARCGHLRVMLLEKPLRSRWGCHRQKTKRSEHSRVRARNRGSCG